MTADRITGHDCREIDVLTIQSVGRRLIAILVVAIVLTLATLLPGIERTVPGTQVTGLAVLEAAGTVVIAGLLVAVTPALARIVRAMLDGPESVVADVADGIRLIVVFVAVIVAYNGVESAVVPLLGNAAWLYDGAFLLIGAVPLALLSVRLYHSLDDMADLFARRVTKESLGDATGASDR